jgi:putative mRNA 3-end processing factor
LIAARVLFQPDPDIRLIHSEIYLDPAEPRKVGIISHGHGDHIGRHEHFIATPATAEFVRIRNGNDLQGTELPYKQKHVIEGWTVELFPAGHILGSAMIRVSNGSGSLVYTGDFRLAPSYTAEPAEIAEADAVIMESTYGASPEWIFPSREELRARLIDLVRDILKRDKTPVLLAYSLGKAQEVLAMLRSEPFPLLVHPNVGQLSAVYQRNGIDLGTYEVWRRQDLRGKVVIVPPHMTREIRRIPRGETVALTGWALRPHRGIGADHGLPLSDHADFGELLSFAERSRTRVVYVTHGSRRFAEELRRRGIRAEFLRRRPQMRLF